MLALEGFFIGLLVAATLTIGWFAGYVVYKLYKGQRWRALRHPGGLGPRGVPTGLAGRPVAGRGRDRLPHHLGAPGAPGGRRRPRRRPVPDLVEHPVAGRCGRGRVGDGVRVLATAAGPPRGAARRPAPGRAAAQRPGGPLDPVRGRGGQRAHRAGQRPDRPHPGRRRGHRRDPALRSGGRRADVGLGHRRVRAAPAVLRVSAAEAGVSVQPWRSPVLERRGAVAAAGPDAGVAWHYGDPTAEQRALVGGGAVVDLSHLGVVTVTGPDRLTWLHSITSQDLAGLAPRTSTETLVLSPYGHIEHAAGVVDDGERTWLLTEAASAPALAAWLDSMRFMMRVEVADVTAEWAAPGWRLAGTWATEALRVAAWRPRFATDVDHRTIPHELDWLRTAVHLHKGCYRGQETVARVHNLGRPPRRLVMLHLDGSGHLLPAPGASVTFVDREVGVVTSVARHHELGPIALAVLRRSTPADVPLLVACEGGDVAAGVL